MKIRPRSIIAIVAGLLVAVVAIAIGVEKWRESIITHNLRMLQVAWLMYQGSHNGQEPASIAEMLADCEAKPEKVLLRPFTHEPEPERYSIVNDSAATQPHQTRTLFYYSMPSGWYAVRENGTVEWVND